MVSYLVTEWSVNRSQDDQLPIVTGWSVFGYLVMGCSLVGYLVTGWSLAGYLIVGWSLVRCL